MMSNRTPKLAVLATTLGLLAAHSLSRAPGLEAATCGEAGGAACRTGQTCIWLGYFFRCSTVYYYWSEKGDGGDEGDKTLTVGQPIYERTFV